MNWLSRLLKHRAFDERDVERVLDGAARRRLAARVTESERHHHGQIRVCVEAGLPLGYLRRHASARDRAVALFGKLRVWDTDANNGVLIYLLLAERAIEIVADRGVAAKVDAAAWAALPGTMRDAFRRGAFEAGLADAIDAVGTLLVTHFARVDAQAGRNELPDEPVVV